MEPEFLEAAQFLPNLPKSNLDDRTFDELVEECLLRIPRYCPEWTNYNPGDPGVTLIELFSWLVHQMLYRFNQVPRRHYVALLELLGIRLDPPKPAHTDLTFYLTKAQSEPKLIRAGTEVATVRTENQEAIVFTTDQDFVIGRPRIKHILMADQVSDRPTATSLRNLFGNTDYEESDPNLRRSWNDLDRPINLFEPCQRGSCFYMVFEPDQWIASENTPLENDISGNILAITFKGRAAVTTGINTDNPPLKWQAWNGEKWEDGILRQRHDDRTKGFSFDQLGQAAPNPETEGVDVILHLPKDWSEKTFDDTTNGRSYQGYWIRCLYEVSEQDQYDYERSPEITGFDVRAIGGTTTASECIKVGEEFLGVSDGKPGQVFQLEGKPILQRYPDEQIRLDLPDGSVEYWQEVSDFADSNKETPYYLIDSQGGFVQFGPLIREPSQIARQTQERSRLQSWGRQSRSREPLLKSARSLSENSTVPAILDPEDRALEMQYGKVPPLGAEIYMTGYRVGGGSRGNVQAQQLSVMKSSIPYVKKVVNYQPATGGIDAESLDDAVMRVPALLRTRKTAVTPEDFEHLARQFDLTPPIYRAHTITTPDLTTPGVVRLLVLPQIASSIEAIDFSRGIPPHRMTLGDRLKKDLLAKIDLHKSLGIRVQPEAPQFVGINVIAEVLLESQYRNEDAQIEMRRKIKTVLYKFLNPIIGCFDPQTQTTPKHALINNYGWPLGRAVRVADIIALLQSIPEVSYVVHVKLFSSCQDGEDEQWVRLPAPEGLIKLNELEVACSWEDNDNNGHDVEFMT